MYRRFLCGSIVVGALAALVYAPMLGAGPIWDDVIVETVQMPHYRSIGDAFFPDLDIQESSPTYYRPFVLLSYMMDRSIAENLLGESADALLTNPLPARPVQHGSNLLFHALASILVYLLATELFRGRSFRTIGALAAGIVFALHPIHAESVCAFTGRSDVLATLFVLLSVYAVLRCRPGGGLGWPFLSAAAFLAAMLSKEVGIAALGMAPLLIWARGQYWEEGKPKGSFRGWLPIGGFWVAAIGIYLGLRTAAGISSLQTVGSQGGGAIERMLRAAGYYAKKGLLPWPQVHYVPELPELWLSVAVLTLAFFGVWLLARTQAAHRTLIYALFASFWVGVAPSLPVALKRLAAAPVAERYLYLPTVALAIMIGLAFGILLESKRLRRAAIPVGVLASLTLVFSSYAQTQVWQSNLNFWEDVVRDETAARYGLVLSNLGEAYQSEGQTGKAMAAYQRAMAPDVIMNDSAQRIVIRHNMGVLKMEAAASQLSSGNPQLALANSNEAIVIFEENRKYLPNAAIIYKTLGHSYLVKAKAVQAISGKSDESSLARARQVLLTALKMDPQSRSARGDLEEIQSLLDSVEQ